MTQNIPQIGDKITLVYGAYYVNEGGTLYGIRTTRWGVEYRVKMADGTFEVCHDLELLRTDKHQGIGAYYEPTSKLRNAIS